MKKVLALFLSLLVLIGVFSGCEMKNEDTIKLSDLSDYSIVYPADWTEWELEDVIVLKNTIEKLSGKETKLVPDTEEPDGKEIILASSSRVTKYAEEIASFDNAMCYLIGVDGKNIVLGGQNFYSDMRAIYDFVNNYLGYDDLEDKYSEMKEKVEGKMVTLWEAPEYTTMGSMFSAQPFQNVLQVKDFVDGNFNVAQIMVSSVINKKGTYTDPAPVRDTLKWCARFGIQAMIYPKISINKEDSNVFTVQISENDETEQSVIDCPAVYGLYLIDEPSESNIVIYRNILLYAKEKYTKLGWKMIINTWTPWYPEIADEARNVYNNLIREYLTDLDVVSFDGYCHNYERRNLPYCDILKKVSDLAREIDSEFIYFIESAKMDAVDGMGAIGAKFPYNYTKGFRTNSYLGLCFDAKMIEYFQYGHAVNAGFGDGGESIIDSDFSINHEYYDYAQKVNAEVKFVTDILKDYEYQGVASDNPKKEALVMIEDPFEDASNYLTILSSLANSSVVESFYKAKEGDGKAVLLVNLDEFTDVKYEDEFNIDYLKLEINGSDYHIYADGAEIEPMMIGGNLLIPFGNGSCYLITIE